MTPKKQKILFIVFVAFFIISAPFVLLYTAGWSFNPKKWKFEKTGGLFINTIIKDASLFINGRPYGNGEEFRIQNLLPGEYEIKISKSGYFDWQKKLSVESKITTFAKNVRLIAGNLPAKSADGATDALHPAPNSLKFAYAKKEMGKNSVFVFDAANDSEKSIASLPLRQTVKNIDWSPNGEKIVLETTSGFQIINISDGKIQTLPPKIRILSLRWDETGGSELFAGASDGIHKIDFLSGKAEKIYSAAKNTDNFTVYQNHLYLAGQSSIEQINLNDKQAVSVSLAKENYKIRSAAKGWLVLIDSKKHLQAFKLPLQKISMPEVSADAKDIDVFGGNFLYYNDFELWTQDLITGKKELITRFGEEIKKARWLSGSDYIAINFSSRIKIIETDKRDSRQIYSFPKFEQISDFFISKKSSLYFSGKVNKASGIYKLEL